MLSSTAGRQGSGAPGPRSSCRCRRPPPAGKPRLGAHVAPGPPTRWEPRSPGGPLMNPLTRTTWQEPSMNRKASDPGGGRPESLLPRVPNASPRGTSRAGSAFGGKGDVFQALKLRGEPAAITGQDATHATLVTGRSSSRNTELGGFWLRLGQERPRSRGKGRRSETNHNSSFSVAPGRGQPRARPWEPDSGGGAAGPLPRPSWPRARRRGHGGGTLDSAGTSRGRESPPARAPRQGAFPCPHSPLGGGARGAAQQTHDLAPRFP